MLEVKLCRSDLGGGIYKLFNSQLIIKNVEMQKILVKGTYFFIEKMWKMIYKQAIFFIKLIRIKINSNKYTTIIFLTNSKS